MTVQERPDAVRDGALPVGTVTFLFTDIEGSTRLLRQLGDRYADVLESHHALVTTAVTDTGGVLFGSRGDALFAVYGQAAPAIAGGLEAQRALRAHPWDGHDVRVRMGIHTGAVVLRGGNYIGLAVHRVARICAAAHGGQLLISGATACDVTEALPGGARLVDRGLHWLKDLPGPERLFELTHPDLTSGANA